MDPFTLDAGTTARIRAWLAAEGVDASYLVFVARHATEPDATWRWCCGSKCDPCVERLGRVVDQTRMALAISPSGIPPADEAK